MKRFSKSAWIISSISFLLLAILTIHVIAVTRPAKADASTQSMARIDLGKTVDEEQSTQFSKWVQAQQGVDHVLCNPANGIIVFTYHPVKCDANKLTKSFNDQFSLAATRFIPSQKDMASGCPIPQVSATYQYFSRLFSN